MPRGLITSAGKAAIAVAGLAWGFSRSFLVPEFSPNGATPGSRFGDPGPRLGDMEDRLARIEAGLERLCAHSRPAARIVPQNAPDTPSASPPVERRQTVHPQGNNNGDYVTRKDFNEALERLEKRLANKVSEKNSGQMLAIGSLRAMICETDALLARVLDRLESLAEYDGAENPDDA